MPPLSLYLHIPWCVQKCFYCDFNSHELKEAIPYKKYLQHLLADLDNDIRLISGRTVNTIFIGGGTPSLFSAKAIQSLISGISKRLTLIPNAEITIEVNPGTIDTDKLVGYKEAGINRISIGLQSLKQENLSCLGRIHSAKDAHTAAQLVASLGICSFNIDLMHSLPYQSLSGALDDLSKVIALEPQHLSWYELTIEPNTFFGSRPPVLPDDDTIWDIYQHGIRMINAAGYRQYEISSYAKEGFQCSHNLNYWRFGDYIGIGCGAYGKLSQPNGTILRTVKTNHPRGYIQGNYVAKLYQVSLNDLPFEYFLNRFRLLEVMPRLEFTEFTGIDEKVIRPALNQALLLGYITENDTHWQITNKGKWFLNSLLELFL